jgi:hypothetical protein
MMDQYLAINTLKWYKYALVLHIVGGMLMYSNSAILPVKDSITSTQFGKQFSSYTKNFNFGTVTSKLMAIYIAVFVSLIALYLIYRLFLLSLIKIFSRVCRDFKKRFLEVETFESDFYSCVSLKALRDILKDTKKQHKALTVMYSQGLYQFPQLTDADLSKAIGSLESKIKTIYFEGIKRGESQLGPEAIKGKSDKEIVKMLLLKD